MLVHYKIGKTQLCSPDFEQGLGKSNSVLPLCMCETTFPRIPSQPNHWFGTSGICNLNIHEAPGWGWFKNNKSWSLCSLMWMIFTQLVHKDLNEIKDLLFTGKRSGIELGAQRVSWQTLLTFFFYQSAYNKIFSLANIWCKIKNTYRGGILRKWEEGGKHFLRHSQSPICQKECILNLDFLCFFLDYKRVPEATIINENYRCWPSYHHKGCLLSVFDVNEAREVCESHSQCKAFVFINQTTWTGNGCQLKKFCNPKLAKWECLKKRRLTHSGIHKWK